MSAPVTFPDAVGIVGVTLYLLSYAALQLSVLRGQTYGYATLNSAAAGCVLFSLSAAFNLSAALIQISWIAISLTGSARLAVLHGRAARIRFAERERRFLAAKLPTLAKPLARRLLDAGRWIDAGPRVVLAREGEPVMDLVYLACGRAIVSHAGHAVGTCLDDTYIGELTCLSGAPATATVMLDSPARYFRVAAAALRQLAARHAELRQALRDSFAGDVRKKLIAHTVRPRRPHPLGSAPSGRPSWLVEGGRQQGW